MGKVYASCDWHGNLDVARQILNYLQPDDKLYFVGDAIDRGPHGFQIMTHLLDDPRVIYMAGNHEMMMLDAIENMLEIGIDDYRPGDNPLWMYSNGGYETFKDMNYGLDVDLSTLRFKLNNMPYLCMYTSKTGNQIILEHAGYSPDKNGEVQFYARFHDPYWDRDHFYDKWIGADNMYVVHGHTPVQYLKFYYGYNGYKKLTEEEIKIKDSWDQPEVSYIPEVIRYCNGHKFDLDMCTIVSGRAALLDLDTLEVKYFDTKIQD